MREQGRSKTGIASHPRVKLAPVSAPGATGERQEHLMRSLPSQVQVRREHFSGSSTSSQSRWATADIPEQRFTHGQSAADPKKVQPIQLGEFLRKYVSALSEGEITALTAAMRQLGVGSQGGAEARAIFHQFLFDEWTSGTLLPPLGRIKVDERHCFGLIEWRAVRKTASSLLPKHAAVAGWKHRALSYVECGVQPMPEGRSAEQGDVCGSLKCSQALGMVTAEAQVCVAVQQAARLCTRGACKMNKTTGCSESKTFSSAAQKNSSEPTIRDMLYKKTEAQHTWWLSLQPIRKFWT